MGVHSLTWLPVIAVALSGCGAPAMMPDAAPWWADAAVASGSAVAPAPGDYVPYIAGGYARVFEPPNRRYLNDHTLVRASDGTWHVYGITHDSNGEPQRERSFLHATAPALLGPWTPQDDALEADPALNEFFVWAPHVVETRPGRWTMFFCYGQREPEPNLDCMRRADSSDLRRWTRDRQTLSSERRPPGGRDAFLMRDGDRWLLYSVAVTEERHGQIVVSANRDLDDPQGWSPRQVVIEDPEPNYAWGNLESPFVVLYAGQYYLFVTRTSDGAHIDYARTAVFRSNDPTRFAWRQIADLRAHAAEIVPDQGRYFITSAGWTGYIGERNRGLSIAPLQWARVP